MCDLSVYTITVRMEPAAKAMTQFCLRVWRFERGALVFSVIFFHVVAQAAQLKPRKHKSKTEL